MNEKNEKKKKIKSKQQPLDSWDLFVFTAPYKSHTTITCSLDPDHTHTHTQLTWVDSDVEQTRSITFNIRLNEKIWKNT